METISLDIPFLNPAGDFPGTRALSSFLTVEDVWVANYRLLGLISHTSLLDGLNDRGTPAGWEPDVENIHHFVSAKWKANTTTKSLANFLTKCSCESGLVFVTKTPSNSLSSFFFGSLLLGSSPGRSALQSEK